MQWLQLLSGTRLGRRDLDEGSGRTPFQRDTDRIVFSSAFRRLQNKTQVHSLPDNDHVRTRLTHSIEVASVGRSLGTMVGERVAQRHPKLDADSFGHIVHAAALAHDIGNPPFGHSGEEAIRHWFRRRGHRLLGDGADPAQLADFEHFEGNAQGFRILTQLENRQGQGGLQLTLATLGAFTKYPRLAAAPHDDGYIGGRKNGFYLAESPYFREVAQGLGLTPRDSEQPYWSRHPLVYLTEAADDICYSIIDIEDGVELEIVPESEGRELLGALADEADAGRDISHLRARAINRLVGLTVQAFMDAEPELLRGSLDRDLLSMTPVGETVIEAKTFARERIFRSEQKARAELAGEQVIGGLLEVFGELVPALAEHEYKLTALSRRHQQLGQIMGRSAFRDVSDRYDALLRVTDFVAGMTDRYAINLFRTLNGISL